MKHKVRVAAIALTLTVLTLTQAHAFLGIGDVVFDPSNYAQAVQQLIRLEQQYRQLVETYQVVRGQYDHALRMARQVPVNMAARYRRLATPWEPLAAANTYGTTAAWVQSVNSGVSVADGYLRSVETLGAYGAGLRNVPPDQQGRVKTAYGAIELADGANVSALATIGALRGSSEAVEAAIARLEADSHSAAPEMNTEIAVLNKLTAASLVAVHAAQDTNKLLVALAEQDLLVRTRERDAQARAVNHHIRFMERGRAALSAQSAGASDAMRAWRMP